MAEAPAVDGPVVAPVGGGEAGRDGFDDDAVVVVVVVVSGVDVVVVAAAAFVEGGNGAGAGLAPGGMSVDGAAMIV